jgi:hypothetical protein
MKEVIPIEQDRHVCAIKVLDGPIEHYRVAATTTTAATRARVRFRLDGIAVDARLCEQNTTAEKLQALADQGALVVAGVFQQRDGTHKLDWLAPPGAPLIASDSMQVRIKKEWRSLPRSLWIALVGGVVAAVAFWLGVEMPFGWNLPFLIVGALAMAALLFALLQMAFSLETIWDRFRRRRTLRLMESVMAKYCGARPSGEDGLIVGEAHGR